MGGVAQAVAGSDRHAGRAQASAGGYVVVLDVDVDEEDAGAILAAIRMVKGVSDVVPVEGSSEMTIATARVRNEMRERLLNLVRDL